ncbi:MAG: GNAT family N-acetyltransferase [Gammaproteobacteria bacterium]
MNVPPRLTPPGWKAMVNKRNSLFFDDPWQQLLTRSLGCRPIYFLDCDGQDGFIVQVFHKGPFRIGYVGYPIGGTVMGRAVGKERIDQVLADGLDRELHVLRIRASAFRPEEGLKNGRAEPETCLLHLQRFKPEADAKLRRALRRSERFHVSVREGPGEGSMAPQMHQLYHDMLRRHGGLKRYGLAYFRELSRLATTEHRVRFFFAEKDKKIAGYLVVLWEGDIAYYLHGAVDPECKPYHVTDRLFYTAIEGAKQAGMTSFNLWLSPPDQPSLVRFKEKWGGVTRPHMTYELPASPRWARVMNTLASAQRLTNRWVTRMRGLASGA